MSAKLARRPPVTGEADDANVYIAGDSGKIYCSFENSATGTWNSDTPGSGSATIDFYDDRKGHAVDGNQRIFETTDGDTYEAIGIEDADVSFYGLDSDARTDVWVSGGGGTVFELTPAGWVPDSGLDDTQLQDIVVDGASGLTVGGGDIYVFDGEKWSPSATPAGENLNAVVTGSTDIAVGAAGTVLER